VFVYQSKIRSCRPVSNSLYNFDFYRNFPFHYSMKCKDCKDIVCVNIIFSVLLLLPLS
jgi:hypothetical protein